MGCLLYRKQAWFSQCTVRLHACTLCGLIGDNFLFGQNLSQSSSGKLNLWGIEMGKGISEREARGMRLVPVLWH